MTIDIDLTNCDREPIQSAGAIQPHGALLVVDEPALRIVQVSANSEAYLGLAPEALLGQALGVLLDDETDPRPTVLILDDSPEDTEAFQRALREDFHVLTAATGAQGRALIAAQPPDCLLLDYMLPDLTGLEFLTARDPAQVDAYAVIVLTGHAEVALAVDCMKHGAHDFLTKGRFRGDELRRAVTQGIEKIALRRQVATQQRELEHAFTDRKAAAEALRQSEARFRLVMEHMSEAVMLFDAQGDLTYQNPASLRLHGFAADGDTPMAGQQLKATWKGWDAQGEPLPPEQWPMARVVRGETVDNQILHAQAVETGRAFDASYNGRQIYDAAGQFALGFITIRDITDERRANQALQESEARLRLALDAARMGIFDWEITTNRIAWTRQHEVLFDFKPGEFGGTYAAFASRVHPEDLPGVEAELARCIAAREPIDCEYRVVWPDGSLHWVAARGEFVFDTTGQPLRVRGVVMEVTERKQAALELCRYQQVVETADEMLIFIDRELRYGMVNPAYARQFQWPCQEFIGRRIEEMLKPDAYAVVAAHLELALAGQPQLFSLQSPHRDGQMCDLEITQQPFRMDGEVQGVVVSLHDVTAMREVQRALEAERARLEERVTARTAVLQASETKLRSIYDLLPVGLAITNPAGQIIDCNRASETLLGLSREAHFQRTYDGPEWTIVRPDGTPMPPEEYASVRAMAEQQTVRDVEMGIVKQEGLTWISVSAMPATHPDHGVVIAYVDITARRQTEDDLRLFKAVADASEEAIAISDLTGMLVYINPAHARLFGYSLEEARRLNYRDYYPPESVAVLEREVVPQAARGESWEGELDVFDRAGRRFPLWERVGAVRDHQDRILYGFGFMHDITERKQTETALRVLTERLQLATEAGGVGVWEWDIVDDRLIWDEQMYALYGARKQDFSGAYAAWVQGLHPEDAAQAQADIEFALRGEQTFRPEFRVRWPDGTVRHIAAFGKVIRDATGVPQRMVGVNWDITEAKQARAAAEQAARVKSEFLAHMSHEIRTPMNAILGLSELALHQSLDPTSREYLEHVHQSAETLLGILNDILDQSRLDTGRLSLDLVAFDLHALLERLRSLFAPTAATKGLDLVIKVDPDVPRVLLGDPLRLQQILSNLLSNALKFTEQGQVRLRVTRREGEGSGARLRWTVTDTGIGMDAGTQTQLFEPFVQGDHSIARRFGGTGLGLSISRRLAELMEGTLTVESQLGVGSAFILDIDLGVAAVVPGIATVGTLRPAPTLVGTRILVAEDQPLNQRVIGDMLRLLGAQVTLANHGGEALARLAEASFDAVLMDIQMPELDGLTATQRIRDNPAWAALPVIALTAGVTEPERERMRAAGMTDLLTKPVTLDALTATLEHWLPAAGPVEGMPRFPQMSREPAGAGALPGFDLSRLRQIAAGEDDLCALLHQFAESVRGDADAIAAALESGDPAAAAQAAHRLKGVAGTVGARALQDAAARLEAALHADGPQRIEALARLRECHAQALAQIAHLPLPGAAEPANAVGNPDEVGRLLGKLRPLVAQRRFVSPAMLTALRAALPASAQSTCQALRAALDQIDYPAAERLLAVLGAADPAPGEPHA